MSLKDCMVHYNYDSVQKYIEIYQIYIFRVFYFERERNKRKERGREYQGVIPSSFIHFTIWKHRTTCFTTPLQITKTKLVTGCFLLFVFIMREEDYQEIVVLFGFYHFVVTRTCFLSGRSSLTQTLIIYSSKSVFLGLMEEIIPVFHSLNFRAISKQLDLFCSVDSASFWF